MGIEKIILSKKGKQELENKLHDLVNIERHECSQSIAEAKAQGDLSENADYHAARERQAIIENEILELTTILENAELNKYDPNLDSVSYFSKVTVYDEAFEEEDVYVIVSRVEANPEEGYISYVSPLGKALFGKKVGDSVTIHAKTDYDVKIVKIEQLDL